MKTLMAVLLVIGVAGGVGLMFGNHRTTVLYENPDPVVRDFQKAGLIRSCTVQVGTGPFSRSYEVDRVERWDRTYTLRSGPVTMSVPVDGTTVSCR